MNYQLSAAQQGIWLGQQLDTTNPTYWTAEYLELEGPLDIAGINAAMSQVLGESEALHMRFSQLQNGLVQHSVSQWTTPPVLDLMHLPAAEARALASQWMQERVNQAADLANDQLWHYRLIRLAHNHHILFFQAHHIVLDGFGYALFMRRLAQCYNRVSASGPSSDRALQSLQPVIEADQAYHESAQHKADHAFWMNALSDRPEPARVAPLQPLSHQVQRVRRTLSSAQLLQWQQTARRYQCDLFCWLSAVVSIWLYSTTGRTSLTLGVPVMNRLGSPALNVPCMHMNIVALPVELQPDLDFRVLIQQIQQTWKRSRPHWRYRYEQLQRELQLEPGQRLFGPVLNLMPFERPLTFADCNVRSYPLSAGPVEDLAINLTPQQEQLIISLEANPAAYNELDLNTHFDTLIALATACCQSSLLSLNVRFPLEFLHRLVLTSFESPLESESPLEVVPLTTKLLRLSADKPNHTALTTSDGKTFSYHHLLTSVQSLAGQMLELGVQPGQRVALMLPRTDTSIYAMLASMWIGACYIPLDPDGPAQRSLDILQHASPDLILVNADTSDRVLPHATKLVSRIVHLETLLQNNSAALLNQPLVVDPATPAYVIYTSGSSGTPNGVEISQQALTHFIHAASTRYQMQSGDAVLQFAPLHFDASIEEIYLALANGGNLVLRNEQVLESIASLFNFCRQHFINVLDLPTAYWHELVYALSHSELSLPDCIRLVIIGGEAAHAGHIEQWRMRVGSQVQLINTYGPTETTVVCTSAWLSGPWANTELSDPVPIGTPLPGLQCVVVDEHLLPVLTGQDGELCILGPMLANGYWRNTALTERRFVTLSWLPGSPRAYRTGDRVTVNQNGTLQYLGRLDDELKISGYRVMPSAVESVLRTHPEIRDCAVIAAHSDNNIPLIAFIDPLVEQQQQWSDRLSNWLSGRVLAAAIPTHFVNLQEMELSQLPTNANNKVDRKILLQLWASQRQHTESHAPSWLPVEKVVAEVWHEVLATQPANTSADFFQLGGKSLQAIQVANRLQQRLRQPITVSTLFRFSRLDELARELSTTQVTNTYSVLETDKDTELSVRSALMPIIDLQTGAGAPLFCIHPADGLCWCYSELSRHLPNLPIVGIQGAGLSGEHPDSLQAMVQQSIERIRSRQPVGPYRLLGWSFGGSLAHAIASELQYQGETIELLAMLDAYPADIWQDAPMPQRRDAILVQEVNLASTTDAEGNPLTESELIQQLQRPTSALATLDQASILRLVDTTLSNMVLYRQSQHPIFEGDIVFFRATASQNKATPELNVQQVQPHVTAWQKYVLGSINIIDIDCHHSELGQADNQKTVAIDIAKRLLPSHGTAQSSPDHYSIREEVSS